MTPAGVLARNARCRMLTSSVRRRLPVPADLQSADNCRYQDRIANHAIAPKSAAAEPACRSIGLRGGSYCRWPGTARGALNGSRLQIANLPKRARSRYLYLPLSLIMPQISALRDEASFRLLRFRCMRKRHLWLGSAGWLMRSSFLSGRRRPLSRASQS